MFTTLRRRAHVLLLRWRYCTRVTALIRNRTSLESHADGVVQVHAPAVGVEGHMTGAVHRTHRGLGHATAVAPAPQHSSCAGESPLLQRVSLPTWHVSLLIDGPSC